jgi:YVTN family beta-propeller protein
VTPITVATDTAGAAITVGALPRGVAFSPDGSKAYVTNFGSNTVTPITVAAGVAGSAIAVGSKPLGVAFSPDGTKAYTANYLGNTVTPITVASDSPGTAIAVGLNPIGVAFSPAGNKAYVTNESSFSVTPITVATDSTGPQISVGAFPRGVAFSPDGTQAYVANNGSNSVTPITVSSNTAGTAITVGVNPQGVAFVPDQAPIASFTTSGTLIPGSSISFDASASTVAYGTIANYAWDFGDDTDVVNTAAATTAHTYTSSGSFTARVTETSSAGTSTTQVFTGQTMSRNGGPSATTTDEVVIAVALSFIAPASASFADTLNGHDQASIVAPAFSLTNSGASGWNVSATSTQFTTGFRTLATDAISVQSAPTITCDTTCTLATNQVSYPYGLPAGSTAPTATKIFNATAATGIGNQTVTPTFRLAIPANTYAGVYTSTWTFTLSSGP